MEKSESAEIQSEPGYSILFERINDSLPYQVPYSKPFEKFQKVLGKTIIEMEKHDNYYLLICVADEGSTREHYIQTYSMKGNFIDEVNMFGEGGESAGPTESSFGGKFVFENPQTLRVKNWYIQRYPLREDGSQVVFDSMAYYNDLVWHNDERSHISYYKISDDGQINNVMWGDDWETLKTLSKDELRLVRNEVFARHGYIFKSEDLTDYFTAFPWYKPQFDNVDDELTEKEIEFITFIRNLEAQKE